MKNKKINKHVKIYIRSAISDLLMAEMLESEIHDGYFSTENGERLPVSELNKKVEEIIEYTTEGKIELNGNRLSVSYDESREMGFDDSHTVLSFDRDLPDTVTMVRTGLASTACRFDPNERRQICTFKTPYMPVEYTINTRSVKNTVNADGGTIHLDYVIEIHGVKTERNLMNIEVKKMP